MSALIRSRQTNRTSLEPPTQDHWSSNFAEPPPNQEPTSTPNMKRRTFSSVIIAGHPTHLSEPTRQFLRGLLVLVLALGSLIALSARGQTNYTTPYYFNTFAGAAIGADNTGKLALFDRPNSTAVDRAGNVYVADFNDHTVRKITPAGVVTT